MEIKDWLIRVAIPEVKTNTEFMQNVYGKTLVSPTMVRAGIHYHV